MPDLDRARADRRQDRPLVEGLRGVLVLVLTTAGVSAAGWLAAVVFATVFR